MKTRRRDIVRDKRGAVLAEFAIAILPMLMAFFGFWQVSMLITAKMLVRHAAAVGARAAAVMVGGGDTNPTFEGEEQGTEDDVRNAVQGAMGTWGENGILTAATEVHDTGGPNGRVTVDVTAAFKCTTPLGGRFVCGGSGTLPIHETASMPKQGAQYK
jgi:Flp pilus assembly protein TadG